MAGQYYSDTYSMTPGSAVADQLQEILTRKRNEGRQAMLDDLNRRQIESNLEIAKANQESLAEQRAANAEYRSQQQKAAEAEAERKNLRDQAIKAVDTSGWTPDLQALWPIVQASGDPNAISTFLTKAMTPKKEDQNGRIITFDEATGQYSLAGGGPFDGKITPLDKVITRNRPPVGSTAGSVPQLTQIPDPDHPGQFKSVWLKPGQTIDQGVDIGGTVRKGNAPTAPRMSDKERYDLARARGATVVEPRGTIGNFILGPKQADPGDQAAYDTLLQGFLTKNSVSPSVAGAIREAESDPNLKNKPLEELFKDVDLGSPEENENFRNLMYIVRGGTK